MCAILPQIIHTLTLPMAKLNNEKVTISFAPASQADENALNSLLPEGNITDESQLPSKIPFYINVKPQLKVNGQVLLELGETSLGEEYTIKQILYTPTRTNTFGQPRLLISGGYYAVNTIVQSVSVEKLKALQDKIKQTQETLQSSNQTQIDSLTREDIMGDMVYAATLSYYAQMIAQGKMATRPLNTEFELVGSSGIIGYKPKIAKRFGLPTGLSAGGMSCDLIDAHMAEQHNNDQTKHVQANQQLGLIGSSLEYQVLEQLFARDTNAEGFSAVKAIQLANEQGQKIYTITKDNYETIIPQLQLAPDAIADIRGAAMAGLTVTTHQKRISVNGYTGEGYIILNERGTGSYMINGGLYGGLIALAQQVYLGIAVFASNQSWLAGILVKELQANLQHIAKAFANVAAIAAVASFALDVLDIYLKCGSLDTFLLLQLGALVGAGIALISFFGPLSIIPLSLSLSIISGKIKENYFREHNCG